MKAFACILDTVFPRCSRCGGRHFALANYSKNLEMLKKVDAYRAEYEGFTKLCRSCWAELTALPCTICATAFDVMQNSRKALLNNLTRHGVSAPDIANAQLICPRCEKRLARSTCSRCKKAFLTHENNAKKYRKSTEVEQWLSPYSQYYSTSWSRLCPPCYDECLSVCADVQKRLKNWTGGTKSEFIRGYRTVKTLGRVDYKGQECSEPAQVESYLKLYSAQLGGNGFVKYYWEKQEKRHSRRVLAGHSRNNNPYYRTEYSIERWFTGYATAVCVEAFKRKALARTGRPNFSGSIRQDVRLAVLDGLNICCWPSSGELLPNLTILLTLCIALAADGLPFICFFDANTGHVLKERAGPEAAKIYAELVRGNLSTLFVEVPGRKRADEFILQKATSDGGHVVSNDQFRDYKDQYIWLANEERLLKGTVADNHLLIPDLQLDRRIRKDLSWALAGLTQKLNA